jgi:Cdc6-like AAA superfamily ATPase
MISASLVTVNTVWTVSKLAEVAKDDRSLYIPPSSSICIESTITGTISSPKSDNMNAEKAVIANPVVFTDKHKPSELKFRQEQIEKMRFCLQNRQSKVNLLLYGRSGSGKSAVIRQVLHEIRKDAVTVNCFECRTLQTVLEHVLAELRLSKGLRSIKNGLLDLPKASTTHNKERLRKYLKVNHLILVLEEMDRIVPKIREEILYNLCELENLTLIFTAQDKDALAELDERVRSRVNPVEIEFAPYTPEQIEEILCERAEFGLAKGSCDEEALRTVAEIAAGNARSAIGILERLALLAESEGRTHISQKDVEHAWQSSRNSQQLEKLRGLNRHHLLIYRAIAEHGELVSSVLRNEYYLRCRLEGLRPVAPRTLRDYPAELVRRGLIQQEPAGAGSRGEAKLYRPL